MALSARPLQDPGRSSRSWLLVLPFLLAGCGGPEPVPIHPADEEARLEGGPPFCPASPAPVVETLATGLEVPWDMERAPDGRIFVTERPGRIRVIDDEGLRSASWATLDVYADSEAGLLGLALSPDFEEDGHVYVAATFLRAGSGLPSRVVGALRLRMENALGIREGGASVVLRVVRFTERDGVGVEPTVIVDGIPAHQLHAGAALAFGPDGALYLTMGDGAIPSTAADPRDRRGTILRYAPDGSVPEDNPVPGDPVFAWGFRDVQGMAWHPEDGELYAVDHGPTSLESEGFRADRDELNRVVPRGDHGWPRVSGRVELEGTVTPLVEWTPAVAPSGLDIHRDPASPWYGNVLVGSLRARSLERVVLAPGASGGLEPVCREPLLGDAFGRLRGVRWDGEGVLVSTSNRDRRGMPEVADDRVLRVTPAPPAAP